MDVLRTWSLQAEYEVLILTTNFNGKFALVFLHELSWQEIVGQENGQSFLAKDILIKEVLRVKFLGTPRRQHHQIQITAF